MALRASLLGRLNDLAVRLAASGQSLHCEIAVDAARHLAEVQCTAPADRGATWSALQGLLLAGPVPSGQASLCLRLSGAAVATSQCAEGLPAALPLTVANEKGEATTAASP